MPNMNEPIGLDQLGTYGPDDLSPQERDSLVNAGQEKYRLETELDSLDNEQGVIPDALEREWIDELQGVLHPDLIEAYKSNLIPDEEFKSRIDSLNILNQKLR